MTYNLNIFIRILFDYCNISHIQLEIHPEIEHISSIRFVSVIIVERSLYWWCGGTLISRVNVINIAS